MSSDPASKAPRCPHCSTLFATLGFGRLQPVNVPQLLYGDTLLSPELHLGQPLSARISLDIGLCPACHEKFAYITFRGILQHLDEHDEDRLFYNLERFFPGQGVFESWTDTQGLSWLVHFAVLPVGNFLTYVSHPFSVAPYPAGPPWKWPLSAVYGLATVRASRLWPSFLWQLWLLSPAERQPAPAFLACAEDALLHPPVWPTPPPLPE